ncbi:MAG: hypothetical protein M1820_000067 [Bogoriella megaspora]|nr:MAG: hypothetical protein M1820_000067 [Bogoriella megaspora]
MREHGNLETDPEANAAAWQAARGAVTGASKWGFVFGVGGILGYAFSPVYRGLTFQFKVFIQMSGMVIGSMIEADHRLRAYEVQVRRRKRMMKDAETWRRFEEEFEEKGTPGVGSDSRVGQGKG